MIHKDKINEHDPSVRKGNPPRDLSAWEAHSRDDPSEFEETFLTTQFNFRLVLCDNGHGMSSYPRIVYPRSCK